MEILERTFYHNTIQQWLLALAVLSLSWVILRLLKALLAKRLTLLSRKTDTDIDDLLLNLTKRLKLFFFLAISVYLGMLMLTLPDRFKDTIQVLLILAFLGQGATWGDSLIEFWVGRFKRQRLETDPASVTTISALGFVVKVILWAVLLLLALENIGVNVTGLVAGLGIGGIAIALAVQNILGDLFASLSIVLDKPFVMGDFVIVDDYLGTVQKVGLKTTRIQSLSGEQLIFSNSDLLSSRIRNYKRMAERRVLFTIGVTYQTPYDKLEDIAGVIKEIIENQQHARLDRVHFKEYGDFSLNYEIVYYVQSPDYNMYMDVQQAINLKIYREFDQRGIEFAYPTQTLFLQNGFRVGKPEINDSIKAEQN